MRLSCIEKVRRIRAIAHIGGASLLQRGHQAKIGYLFRHQTAALPELADGSLSSLCKTTLPLPLKGGQELDGDCLQMAGDLLAQLQGQLENCAGPKSVACPSAHDNDISAGLMSPASGEGVPGGKGSILRPHLPGPHRRQGSLPFSTLACPEPKLLQGDAAVLTSSQLVIANNEHDGSVCSKNWDSTGWTGQSSSKQSRMHRACKITCRPKHHSQPVHQACSTWVNANTQLCTTTTNSQLCTTTSTQFYTTSNSQLCTTASTQLYTTTTNSRLCTTTSTQLYTASNFQRCTTIKSLHCTTASTHIYTTTTTQLTTTTTTTQLTTTTTTTQLGATTSTQLRRQSDSSVCSITPAVITYAHSTCSPKLQSALTANAWAFVTSMYSSERGQKDAQGV
ncbi:hypothetical protein WJX84_007332 [Apatococcus fuscideae]|uniref:Uncharacterized protein n=1 Tax=Apatococcus fuscideae TaxID=2026836 RepID=A0AAW1SBU5_9CHLO